jgi:uncharacterized protein
MPTAVSSPQHSLSDTIDRLAHLLPAQGPISIFIHHNTLHAFEDLPFEAAVEQAAIRLGREPYLAEARYRDKLASGRIRAKDVERLLVEQLGESAAEDVAGVASRKRVIPTKSSGEDNAAFVGAGEYFSVAFHY